MDSFFLAYVDTISRYSLTHLCFDFTWRVFIQSLWHVLVPILFAWVERDRQNRALIWFV